MEQINASTLPPVQAVPTISVPWRSQGGRGDVKNDVVALVAVELLPQKVFPTTRRTRRRVRQEMLRAAARNPDPDRTKDLTDPDPKFGVAHPFLADPSGRHANWSVKFTYHRRSKLSRPEKEFERTVEQNEALFAAKMVLADPGNGRHVIIDQSNELSRPDVFLIAIDKSGGAKILRGSELVKKFVEGLDEVIRNPKAREVEFKGNRGELDGTPVVRLEGMTANQLRDQLLRIAQKGSNSEGKPLGPMEQLVYQLKLISEYFKLVNDPKELEVAKLFLDVFGTTGKGVNTQKWSRIRLYYEIEGTWAVQNIIKKFTNHLKGRGSLESLQHVRTLFREIIEDIRSLGKRFGGFFMDRNWKTWVAIPAGLFGLWLINRVYWSEDDSLGVLKEDELPPKSFQGSSRAVPLKGYRILFDGNRALGFYETSVPGVLQAVDVSYKKYQNGKTLVLRDAVNQREWVFDVQVNFEGNRKKVRLVPRFGAR